MGLTAIGRAYLWSLPKTEQRNLIERIMANVGPNTEKQVEHSISVAFSELDNSGTCCVSDGYLRDTFGIALPVRIGRQGVLMGLSCGNAVVRPDLTAEHRRITPVLRAAALELQALMASEDGIP
jgi:DNA-binding IclR family transcriptional regulator